MEIRHNEAWADKTFEVDPITWRVDRYSDLEDWQEWFTEKDVKHSRIFTGMKGWVLAAEDPDGRIVRLHTSEEHEWTRHTDHDAHWLMN